MESWSGKRTAIQESFASIAAARDVIETSRLQIASSRALIKRARERLKGFVLADKEPPRKPIPPPDPERTEEARQVAQEYADEQRAIMKKLRQKMN